MALCYFGEEEVITALLIGFDVKLSGITCGSGFRFSPQMPRHFQVSRTVVHVVDQRGESIEDEID